MTRFARSQNLADLARLVHQLKGAGGGYGFDEISKVAADGGRGSRKVILSRKIQSDVEALITLICSVEGFERTPGDRRMPDQILIIDDSETCIP